MEMIIAINKFEPIMLAGISYSFLFSVFYASIISFVLNFIPDIVRKASGILLFSIITLIFCSQLIYYKVFKTYYTVFSAAKGGQIVEFIRDIVYMVGVNIHWIIICLYLLFHL